MNNREILETTPREFDLMIQGKERERKIQEDLVLDKWRQTRFLAFNAIQPHLKKEHSSMSIYEFLPLPGDPTKEELVKARYEVQEEEKSEGALVMEMYRNMKKGDLINNDTKQDKGD